MSGIIHRNMKVKFMCKAILLNVVENAILNYAELKR